MNMGYPPNKCSVNENMINQSMFLSRFVFSVTCFFLQHYPLVNIQKAIENGPFTVDFPIKNCDFP